jgi:glutathione S-transferase
MPSGTAGLNCAFEDAAHALITGIYPYALPASHAKMNPTSAAYFRRTREESWGKTLENLTPKGEEDAVEWKKLKDGFGKVDEWIRANGESSRFIMGDVLCYADMWMAAYALWIKLVLPDRWEELSSWHEGRWARLLQEMEKYETVV